MHHHIEESHIQREIMKAIRLAGIVKGGSAHTFRHSFTTHLLENPVGILRSYNPKLFRQSLHSAAPFWSISSAVVEVCMAQSKFLQWYNP